MATVLKQFTKDPQADKDYIIDWSRWLQPGEVITGAAWTITPAGGTSPLAKHDEAIIGGTKTSAFLKDGDLETTYVVTCSVTTNNTPPRKDDRSIGILVAHE